MAGKIKDIIPESIKQPLRPLQKAASQLKTSYLMKFSRIHPAPVIILGNPKSGTSAIAALVGRAAGKTVIIDMFHLIKEPNFRELLYSGEMPLRDLMERYKFYFSTEIIKETHLTFFYAQLAEYFPQAKFAIVVRDPRANIRSILNRLKIPGNLEVLPDSYLDNFNSVEVKGWRLQLEGKLPDVPGANYIERMAHRWNIAADVYLQHPDKVVLMRYEDFMQDKVGTIGKLTRQLGWEPVNDISDRVDVQYQPRGDRSIAWREFFGAENLRRIETICGDRMQQFNYQPSSPDTST
ncbi:MAG TPA: sulfotransferase [Oscillatoriaceae cyanobacterium M33_DOE_052]|uniref:Sulfotransferase n=1 Tax=Planktothricoides sp. SpSt-374 TaxID=2282167 RepID=A0A7C3ZQH6_9CYAN|nr:sulfotransferase [Oscillatoriaceae cyanobacterium M33_DOE_052]